MGEILYEPGWLGDLRSEDGESLRCGCIKGERLNSVHNWSNCVLKRLVLRK